MSAAQGYSLGVDLAERYSAAVLLDPEGAVLGEWVADFEEAEKPPNPTKHTLLTAEFWDSIANATVTHAELENVSVVIEDLHQTMFNPKPALRVQGALILCMAEEGITPVLIMASQWQTFFGYKKEKGKTSKAWAKAKAEELGFESMLENNTAKNKSDLADAYLIAEWNRQVRLMPKYPPVETIKTA